MFQLVHSAAGWGICGSV